MRGKVSVIIPARKEKYIRDTLEDLYEFRAQSIETILVIDGEYPKYQIPEYPGLKIIHFEKVQGMRNCINAAAEAATGKFLMKIDAHCTVGPDWDKILKNNHEEYCISIPRRYWFNAPIWSVIKEKPHVDAMSYIYPFVTPYKPYLTCRPDEPRQEREEGESIVEDMGFQGSCWFMTKEHFERIGPMDNYGYGSFSEEPQELGLKTQLGPWGGKIIRNKKTWYAHWSKPSKHWTDDPDEAGRVKKDEFAAGNIYCWDYWWHNKWEQAEHTFQWLVDKFWPLNGWPDNWKWLVTQYNRYEIDWSEQWQSVTGTPI